MRYIDDKELVMIIHQFQNRDNSILTIFSETKLEVLQDMSKEPPNTIIKSQAA
jgi:hypothetical protein